MEGKVDNIVDKVSDLRFEVTEHRVAINNLHSEMQQVQSDANSAKIALKDADKGREDLAKALKDADEKRVADAKAIVDQSASTWITPTRLAGIFGVIFAGLGVMVAAWVAVKTGVTP